MLFVLQMVFTLSNYEMVKIGLLYSLIATLFVEEALVNLQ